MNEIGILLLFPNQLSIIKGKLDKFIINILYNVNVG